MRASRPSSGFSDWDAEIYDRYAPAVYQQALLMLGDESLAGQLACRVVVNECIRSPALAKDDARVPGRLAVAVLRSCEPLAARDDANGMERAVLGLVRYGGLGYREAARELSISAPVAAALLRAALLTGPKSPSRPPSE